MKARELIISTRLGLEKPLPTKPPEYKAKYTAPAEALMSRNQNEIGKAYYTKVSPESIISNEKSHKRSKNGSGGYFAITEISGNPDSLVPRA